MTINHDFKLQNDFDGHMEAESDPTAPKQPCSNHRKTPIYEQTRS